jgi:hypothetical protein
MSSLLGTNHEKSYSRVAAAAQSLGAPEFDQRAFLRSARELQGRLERSKQAMSAAIFQIDGKIYLRLCILSI